MFLWCPVILQSIWKWIYRRAVTSEKGTLFHAFIICVDQSTSTVLARGLAHWHTRSASNHALISSVLVCAYICSFPVRLFRFLCCWLLLCLVLSISDFYQSSDWLEKTECFAPVKRLTGNRAGITPPPKAAARGLKINERDIWRLRAGWGFWGWTAS